MAAVFIVVNFAKKGPSLGLKAEAVAPISNSDWIQGNPEAAVQLIEYGDFQCPACGYYYPIVKVILEKYNDRILFAYRDFPLSQIHRNAISSARAAEAAGLQDKYWEIYDLLFENQSQWSDRTDAGTLFEGYANSLGLDLKKFKTDFNSQEVKDEVDDEYRQAVSEGVNSTPTFFLNGKAIQPANLNDFQLLIENEFPKE